jgi:hypothetical protein
VEYTAVEECEESTRLLLDFVLSHSEYRMPDGLAEQVELALNKRVEAERKEPGDCKAAFEAKVGVAYWIQFHIGMKFHSAVPEFDGDKKVDQSIFHSWEPGAWTAARVGNFGLVDACRFE